MCLSKLLIALLMSAFCSANVLAGELPQTSETALRASLERLSSRLKSNEFQRPIYLASSETSNGLTGEVYGIVDYPIGVIRASLGEPDYWCDVLMLHINNRACQVSNGQAGRILTLSVVRRYDQPAEKAFGVAFTYRLVSTHEHYFSAQLTAGSGPLGTSNYRIVIEAIPISNTRSFLHFSYSYDHSTVTRLGTQAYFATFGRGKVGFTVLRKAPSGEPELIGGMLGLVERNSMRYFLTVDAYLSAADASATTAFERRLDYWFKACETYPRQLHEVDWDTYRDLKRADAQQRRVQR